MKYFLDTAKIEEISKWKCFIEGVTTNPSILKKENITAEDLLRETKPILGYKTVFIQLENERQFKEMTENAPFNPNVIFKVPLLPELYPMIKNMGNYKTCGTITYDTIQFNQACELGCNYSIVLVHKNSNKNFLEECVAIKQKYNFRTDIIAASFRNPEEVKRAILSGEDYATLTPDLLAECFVNIDARKDYEAFYKGDNNDVQSGSSDSSTVKLKAVSQ